MREWLEGQVRASPSDLPVEHEEAQGVYIAPADRAVNDVLSSCVWKGSASRVTKSMSLSFFLLKSIKSDKKPAKLGELIWTSRQKTRYVLGLNHEIFSYLQSFIVATEVN